jgi:hypothetical protein
MTAPRAPMADVGEMCRVHTMMRREFNLLPDLIRGADRNDAKRRALIGAHAQLVCQILRTHHKGKDLVLGPLLLERSEAEAIERRLHFLLPRTRGGRPTRTSPRGTR